MVEAEVVLGAETPFLLPSVLPVFFFDASLMFVGGIFKVAFEPAGVIVGPLLYFRVAVLKV